MQTSQDFRPQPQSPTVGTNHLRSGALVAPGPKGLQQAGISGPSLGASALLWDWGGRPPGNVRDALRDELGQVMLDNLLPLEARENQDASAEGPQGGRTAGQRCQPGSHLHLALTPALAHGY